MHYLEFAKQNKNLITLSIGAILDRLGIVYFGYNRFYKNFKGLCLYSNTELFEHLGEQDKVPFIDEKGIILDNGEYYSNDFFEILDVESSTELTKIKTKSNQIKNIDPMLDFSKGICIIIKGLSYHESFFFIGQAKNHKLFYYQNKKLLYEICRLFQNYIFKNMPNGSHETFIPHFKNINKKNKIADISILSNKLLIQTNYGDVLLSKQESRCIEYLSKGFTNIEIANNLNLSPKTIENYIVRLKYKTNTYTRKELQCLFNSSIIR